MCVLFSFHSPGYTIPMMRYRHIIAALLIGLLAACSTDGGTTPTTTGPQFPTATPGRDLSIAADFSGNITGNRDVSNPATVAARASLPTPTADTSTCPFPGGEATLSRTAPTTESEIVNIVLNFLNQGGDIDTLRETFTQDWRILGETGFIRADDDLTGEGVPEIMISHRVPEGGSALLILGCANGRYVVRHQEAVFEGNPPQIIQIDDLNQDSVLEVMYVNPTCDSEDTEDCTYETRLIAWQASLGRFVNVLGSRIEYTSWPDVLDRDNDDVDELILYLDNQGDATTGPLRTGISTYDWNGTVYVLSIWEPDPPRFRIQIIHQADRYFLEGDMALAMTNYDRALNDPDLRRWRNGEDDILAAYSLYRALVAQAIIGQTGGLTIIMQRIEETFPTADIVYVQLAQTFMDAYAQAADLSQACAAVRTVIEEQRPEALDLINRYGENNPTYSINDLCPY